MINLLENQTEITDLYSELSYDELKDVLEGWLNQPPNHLLMNQLQKVQLYLKVNQNKK